MPREPIAGRKAADGDAIGKRITFDRETMNALHLLAQDRMSTLQELADEAFRDLLKKHNRPTDLRAQLRQSARQIAGNDNPAKPKARGRR
jgi:hypothetical protein